MHKLNEVQGNDLVSAATQQPPFGPGFSSEQAEEADKLEVWGSSFNDPGPDYCAFKLLKAGEVVAERTVGGF